MQRAHWTSSMTSRRTHCSGFSGRQGTSSHYQKIDLGMVSSGKECILSGIAHMRGGGPGQCRKNIFFSSGNRPLSYLGDDSLKSSILRSLMMRARAPALARHYLPGRIRSTVGFISTEGALRRPLTYDNPIPPIHI